MGKTVSSIKKDYELVKGQLDAVIKRKEELDEAIGSGSRADDIQAKALALDQELLVLNTQLTIMRPAGAPIIYVSC